MINLIGISGYIGSGKDTVGKIIQHLTLAESDPHNWGISEKYGFTEFLERNHAEFSPWKIKKFAGKLKQMVSLLTGIPVEDLEKQEVKDSLLGSEWETFISLDEVVKTGTGRRPLKVRELLQRLGTDAVRDKVHQNAWVNALFADYKDVKIAAPGAFHDSHAYVSPKWIITDVRFPNEAQAIKDRGGIIIRVNRDYMLSGGPEDKSKLHPSETSLDNWDFDYVIENNGTKEELIRVVRGILSMAEICV